MTPIVWRIEIARPPEEIFSYVTDPSRFSEWQKGVVGGHMEGGIVLPRARRERRLVESVAPSAR